MKQAQYDVLMGQRKYEEAIERLEEELQEEYEELLMFYLCRAYLAAGEEKKAKKTAKKCHNLFPAGDYVMEIEEMLSYIEQGRADEYLRNINQSGPSTLSEIYLQNRKKEKKQAAIPENIKECFEGVVGMENVQIELDKFYKLLRFQKERQESRFNAELLKSTHFAVAGARGSGKTLVGEIISGLLYDFGVRAKKNAVRMEAEDLLAAGSNNAVDGIRKLFDKAGGATVIIENIQDILEENAGNNHIKNTAAQLRRAMQEKKDALSVVITGSREAITKLQILDDAIQDVLYGVIEIHAYSPEELLEIARKLAAKKALRLHPSAEKALLRKIRMECRSPEFMNVAALNRYLDQAAVKMAQRYFEGNDGSDAAKACMMPEDFEAELEEEGLHELLAEMDHLTGLHNVKAQIKKRIEAVIIEQQSGEKGGRRETGHGTLHMLFTGNPGTGKTMVAALVGKIYKQLGILPNGGRMVSCTRSDLIGQYQGHTAKLVKEKVKEAMGGVLFIDEAYALCRGDNDSYGHEAVDELIVAMENNKDCMMVILAGYQEEMHEFLKSNPGFKSRIRNEIAFEDYSVEEMTDIFQKMAAGRSMTFEPDMDGELRHMIEQKSKTPDFGNARGVRNLFEEVIEEMNARLIRKNSFGAPVSAAMYDRLTKEDIRAVAGRKTDGEKSLEELMEELNGLAGLSSVKAKVQEMVDDIRVKAYMRQAGIAHDTGHGTLHLVFKGNAGTGKTTVARLLGRIYKKLGLLQKNVFIETGRKDLVGQYQGHTAKKVMEKIKEAQGGILFIDEAYALAGSDHDDFGLEAVNTLVAELENRRENLMVIVAGYAQEMDQFLDANQGLASRLSTEIRFEDYTDEELLLIFKNMADKKGMKLADGLESAILRRICEEKEKAKDFGNARGVRNMVEQAEKKKNSRIAKKMGMGGEIDRDEVVTLTEADIAQI